VIPWSERRTQSSVTMYEKRCSGKYLIRSKMKQEHILGYENNTVYTSLVIVTTVKCRRLREVGRLATKGGGGGGRYGTHKEFW
jgi:hypothetical protein